ncbi:hypothetical protein BU17DRAFT_71094 [Hysterangium stoloniferum]|nr:hypothetical protein BU17DRAFT_71094 [Hysterangium stoloniferum]
MASENPTDVARFTQYTKDSRINLAVLFLTARYFGVVAFLVQVTVGQNTPQHNTWLSSNSICSCTAWMRLASSVFVASQCGMTAVLIYRAYIVGSYPGKRYVLVSVMVIVVYQSSQYELSRSLYGF